MGNILSLTISDAAAQRILYLKKQEKENTHLRISVTGGGCSGFQYILNLDNQVNSDDYVFEKEGAQVVIDSASLELIQGSQLDYVEDLIGSSFQIKNPKAQTSCGCGNSFSLS